MNYILKYYWIVCQAAVSLFGLLHCSGVNANDNLAYHPSARKNLNYIYKLYSLPNRSKTKVFGRQAR
jgi:hypothetical protein